MKRSIRYFITMLLILIEMGTSHTVQAQEESIARQWTEQVLAAIRKDLARPPVHGRNLFHVSAAMYDAWSVYDPDDEPFLLGRTRGSYNCLFNGVAIPDDIEAARTEAISFAAYRIITHRYQYSPGQSVTQQNLNALMAQLGYDRFNTSTDYVNGGPAELGNYIAQEYIYFGYSDGSNEGGNYAHLYYAPVNPPIEVEEPGNPSIIDPNRWQQITVTNAIDQNGNPVQGTPPPVGHEWGNVVPYAMDPGQATLHVRDGNTYKVYHDPGLPAQIDTNVVSGLEDFYKWSFCMVPVWQSHLDPDDGVMIDISPASFGGLTSYPTTQSEYESFYDFFNGGAPSPGYAVNPVTGEPYEPQIVKRGDYARILAEFWADGPNSETPPGHWFTIMHSVMDHPLFERKWMGLGDDLDPLEYDVKAYLTLGGAMHDAATAAWSIKGWYDYVRPVSAIRYMADKGQSTDPLLPRFHPAGIPLIPGYIEMVEQGDPLAGDNDEHVDKIKLYTWRGPDYIDDPETDYAGVDWILAENWWPYQRPSFVTPPFAGYVSGHSTFSRTAAEVLTLITGDPFFPGGMSNFHAPMNEFLEFEEGPSEDIYLQWATYRDASDQTSLSRIWGGIHPPVDDIPGRLIGQVLGPEVVDFTNMLFGSQRPQVASVVVSDNSVNIADIGSELTVEVTFDRTMDTSVDPILTYLVENPTIEGLDFLQAEWMNDSIYTVSYEVLASSIHMENINLRITGAKADNGLTQDVVLIGHPFMIDTDRPEVLTTSPSEVMINDAVAASGTFTVSIEFSEACDQLVEPTITFTGGDPSSTLSPDAGNSGWTGPMEYIAAFSVSDANTELADLVVEVDGVVDVAGNSQLAFQSLPSFSVDTRNPVMSNLSVTPEVLSLIDVGSSALVIIAEFDEALNTAVTPEISYPDDDPTLASLTPNFSNSYWIGNTTYRKAYNLLNADEQLFNITAVFSGYTDNAGNPPEVTIYNDLFVIDTHRATVSQADPSVQVITDAHVGTGGFHIDVIYPEMMDVAFAPFIQLTSGTSVASSLQYSASQSTWLDAYTYRASFNVSDQNLEVAAIGLDVNFARDLAGNVQFPFATTGLFSLDTRDPLAVSTTSNTYVVTEAHVGAGGFVILTIFDEAMDVNMAPSIELDPPSPLTGIITLDPGSSSWLNSSTYQWVFDVGDMESSIGPIGISISDALDVAGNAMQSLSIADYFTIDIQVGLAELGTVGAPSIFPNPVRAGETITLTVTTAMEDVALMIHDARGALVHSEYHSVLNAGRHVLTGPLSSAGLYLIRLEGRTTTYDLKLLVE